MLFLRRKRFFLWLIRAYIGKWKKIIFAYFLIGILVFFAGYSFFKFEFPKIAFGHRETIGMVGSYTIDILPGMILGDVSGGLTSVGWSGIAKKAIASSWQIENNGKTYVFHLKHNVFFSDGTKLTSFLVQYNFKGVKVTRPGKYTIVFNLKEPYAPFLLTVSQPIFKKNFVGVGKYKIKSLSLNGTFVKSIVLQNVKKRFKTIEYDFYPTQSSLKLAFALGEVSKIIHLSNPDFGNISFYDFKNDSVVRETDYNHLATLFYSSTDSLLSDKRLRDALSYGLPDSFPQGYRNYTPFNPSSFANYQGTFIHAENLALAKNLLSAVRTADKIKGQFSFVLQTIPSLEQTALSVKKEWGKLGIKIKIEGVSQTPSMGSFQIFLGEFNTAKDPDQYTLWHSDQINNITGYKDLRIDSLLEQGRQTVSLSKREQIYSSFEKYFADDPAASFLYFPYTYSVFRK